MKKIVTLLRYSKEFFKYGHFRFFFASIIYIFTKKSISGTKILKSSSGLFLNRKGSIDFQFGNFAYEWEVKKFYLEHFKDYNVFIDIGGNIGTYTIMLGNKGLRTITFEPSKENFRALTINVLLNKLESNATLFNVGLSDKDESGVLVWDPVNTGASHLEGIDTDEPETDKRGLKVAIELTTFDKMIPKMHLSQDDKILMKIDVEGMEINVIEGAVEFFKQFPNILVVIESVHSGEENLKKALSKAAEFEFLPIDSLNFAARKVKNNHQ